jgi:ABC-type Co2+ transport system permease subunit
MPNPIGLPTAMSLGQEINLPCNSIGPHVDVFSFDDGPFTRSGVDVGSIGLDGAFAESSVESIYT